MTQEEMSPPPSRLEAGERPLGGQAYCAVGADIHYAVGISNTSEQYRCRGSQNLLAGMEALARKGIPVGCRGGGCGVCKVRIEAGRVHTEKMSRGAISADEEAHGLVLACRAYPQSDLQVSAVAKLALLVERSHARSFLDAARACKASSPATTPSFLDAARSASPTTPS